MKKMKIAAIAAACLFTVPVFAAAGCTDEEETVVLRVSNWEEYIDLGGWDDEEAIDIANAYTGEDHIMGVNSVVDDFTEWFNSQDHGFKVRVEYSTFGTNEDLYNQLNLGDVYDLVCPSDYMIMKLLASGDIQPFSDDFMDASDPRKLLYKRRVALHRRRGRQHIRPIRLERHRRVLHVGHDRARIQP